MRVKTTLAVVCAFVALRAQADALADIKAAVNRLGAKQPIHATYATQESAKASGRWANMNTNRSTSVEVAHDAEGVKVIIPQALLDKAGDEERAHSGSMKNVSSNAIARISPMHVANALDARATIIGLLNIATVTKDQRVAWQGRNVRMLILKLTQRLTKDEGAEIGSVSVDEDRMNLYLGDDNVPLFAERVSRTTAGFMMFKGTESRKRSWTFGRYADRLILVRYEQATKRDGLGQNFEGMEIETIAVH